MIRSLSRACRASSSALAALLLAWASGCTDMLTVGSGPPTREMVETLTFSYDGYSIELGCDDFDSFDISYGSNRFGPPGSSEDCMSTGTRGDLPEGVAVVEWVFWLPLDVEMESTTEPMAFDLTDPTSTDHIRPEISIHLPVSAEGGDSSTYATYGAADANGWVAGVSGTVLVRDLGFMATAYPGERELDTYDFELVNAVLVKIESNEPPDAPLLPDEIEVETAVLRLGPVE
jgi:hypothetical protein